LGLDALRVLRGWSASRFTFTTAISTWFSKPRWTLFS
jgi:hypothetical protein